MLTGGDCLILVDTGLIRQHDVDWALWPGGNLYGHYRLPLYWFYALDVVVTIILVFLWNGFYQVE